MLLFAVCRALRVEPCLSASQLAAMRLIDEPLFHLDVRQRPKAVVRAAPDHCKGS